MAFCANPLQLERMIQEQERNIRMVKDLTKLSVFLEEVKNRSQPTEIQSLWHMSVAEIVETLHNAVLELTPVAVKSGWLQESAIVFAIHELQCDVDNMLVQLMFVATHPKEEFDKSGYATMCFTKDQFTGFVSLCAEKLCALQIILSVEKRSPHLWPPQSHRGGYNPPQWGISWRCTLNVVPTTGTQFTVIAESSSTIEEVMVTIQKEHNIPPGHCLVFAGKLLMMDKTLAYYKGIQKETTVHMVNRNLLWSRKTEPAPADDFYGVQVGGQGESEGEGEESKHTKRFLGKRNRNCEIKIGPVESADGRAAVISRNKTQFTIYTVDGFVCKHQCCCTPELTQVEMASQEEAAKKKELIQADEERAKAYEAFAARGDWTNPLPRSMRPGKQPPPVALRRSKRQRGVGSDEHDVIDLDPPGAAQVQQPLVQQPDKEEEKQPEKGQPLATSGSAEWLFEDSRLQFMKNKREIDAAFQKRLQRGRNRRSR